MAELERLGDDAYASTGEEAVGEPGGVVGVGGVGGAATVYVVRETCSSDGYRVSYRVIL